MSCCTYSRRFIINSVGLSLPFISLSGCISCGQILPRSDYNPKRDTPVRIDTHAHIFNAEDLPIHGVAAFIVRTYAPEIIRTEAPGPIGVAAGSLAGAFSYIIEQVLQLWTVGFKNEHEHLCKVLYHGATGKLDIEISNKDLKSAIKKALDDRNKSDKNITERQNARKTIQQFYDFVVSQRSDSPEIKRAKQKRLDSVVQDQFSDWMNAFEPRVLDEAISEARQASTGNNNKVFGVLLGLEALAILVLRLWKPEVFKAAIRSHFGNAEELIRLFGSSRKRSKTIDIFVTSDVDMDLWADQGDRGSKNTRQQVHTLMEKTALATNGRIMPFAAFDPLREARFTYEMHAKGQTLEESPLALAKTAILNQGFAGIKLYPPMGFKAFFNCDFDLPNNNHHWPYKVRHIPDLGKRMDEALRALYQFCLEYDVPIMAHANQSFHSHPAYIDYAQPRNWGRLLDASGDDLKYLGLHDIGNLRLNLGHLAHLDTTETFENSWVEQAVDIMKPENKVFGDLANYEEIHQKHARDLVERNVNRMLSEQPVVAERLMFGTDWWMLASDKKVSDYVHDMQRAISEIKSVKNDDFFGDNAINFLGLNPTNKTFKRLRKYYSENPYKQIEPDWMKRLILKHFKMNTSV